MRRINSDIPHLCDGGTLSQQIKECLKDSNKYVKNARGSVEVTPEKVDLDCDGDNSPS